MSSDCKVMKAYEKMAESQKTIEQELKKFETVITVFRTLVEESVDKIVRHPNYKINGHTKQTS